MKSVASHQAVMEGRSLSVAIRAAMGVFAGVCATTAAFAQDAGPEVSEIVVTGSRIRGAESVGSSVIALDREVIVESGAPSTGDLLRKVPQIVGLGASETASGAQNGAANATRSVAVNLRGIGSNATLLLVGGRRMPAAGTQGQITDASVIPSIALERLEVVADGGSAIYGSDAVTGVVNLIPRRDFTGAESTMRYGMGDEYYDWSVAQLFGTGWDSGHAMIAADFTSHSALEGADRDFYTSDLRSRGGTDFRSQQCVPGNIVVNNVPYAIPATSNGQLTPGSVTANTRNLCDNIKNGDIIPNLRRASVFFAVDQDITESTSLFAEGFYSKRTFALQAAQVVSNLTVTNANPFYFNPTGGTGPITVQYDLSRDGGRPNDPGYAESWQGVMGLRQELGGDWQLEVYGSYGESEDEVERVQNLNTTPGGINAALAITDPARAFNPFGVGGITHPDTVASVRNGQFIINGDTDLTVVAAQVDGSLFSIPGGSVKLAAGAEYREEGLGGLLSQGSTAAPVYVPSKAGRDVTAFFAETLVPIVGASNALPGVRSLDLSLAGRYEEYSDFGDTFNPKFGLNWSPFSALTVHGTWGESFRAPGLAENDPRSGGYGLYGDTLPCSHRPPATTCFGIGIAGGNADLKPEEATTWSVGFDVHPDALPGFRASLTYFSIDYDNQIVGLRGTAGLLTNPIYAQYRILDPTPAQVDALRNSGLPVNSSIAGTVTYIQDGRRHNLSSTIAKGLDADVRNVWQTGIGDLSAGINATYFTKLVTSTGPGAPAVDVADTINFPQRFRSRADFGWRREALDVVAFVNYVGDYKQTGVVPVRDIDDFMTVDVHVGYDLDALVSGLSVALDVSNATDEEPPFVNISGGYDPQSASPIGRVFAVSLRKTW
jgi:iron complex outermembrane receptor protein